MTEYPGMIEKFRVADPRDLTRCLSLGGCDETRHHVDFVGVGHGNQKVGIFHPCGFENIGTGAASGDDLDIQVL